MCHVSSYLARFIGVSVTRPRNVDVTGKRFWSSLAIYPIGSISMNPYVVL